MTDPLREASPCVFGPEREPWNCRTHRGGVRTRLNESVCSIVVAEGQYGVPLSEEELVEVRVWMRNRRGKPASRGMLAAERLLATLDLERALAATPSPTAHGPDGNEGYCRCGYYGGGHEHRDLANHLAAPTAGGLDVERLRHALHEAGVRCSPNIPYCRASHRSHAEAIANEYAALQSEATATGERE